jgi:hypothetical protein
MDKKIYRVGASYGDEVVVFHLRSISVAEENGYTNRFLDLSTNESTESKAKKEHDIFVDSIASWSDIGPTSAEQTQDGVKFVPLFSETETPADAVRKYFENSDAEKSRIAIQVVLAFRQKLQPRVVFY